MLFQEARCSIIACKINFRYSMVNLYRRLVAICGRPMPYQEGPVLFQEGTVIFGRPGAIHACRINLRSSMVNSYRRFVCVSSLSRIQLTCAI